MLKSPKLTQCYSFASVIGQVRVSCAGGGPRAAGARGVLQAGRGQAAAGASRRELHSVAHQG